MPVSGFSSRTYTAVEFELSRAGQRSLMERRAVEQVPPGTPTPSNPPLIGPPQGLRGGFLVAFDPVTRKERWRNPGGGGIWRRCAGNRWRISCSRLSTTGDCSPTPPRMAKSYSKSRQDKQAWGRPSRTNSTANSTSPLWAGQARQAGVDAASPPRMYTFVLDGKASMP